MRRHFNRSLVFILALVLTLPAAAQTLIDQVPSSAAMYVSWRGSTDMGPAYEGSNLQGMLKEIGLIEAVPELVDLLQDLQAEGHIGQDEAEILEMVSTLTTSIWADGGAMYMLPPDPEGPPIPRLCVLWKKGEQKAQVGEALEKVKAMLAEQLPTFSGELDKAMYLSVGFDPAEVKVKSLSTLPRFQTAVKQVQGDSALMLYIDAKEWIKQIDQFAAMMRDQAEAQQEPLPPFAQLWPTVRDATGLAGLDSLAMTAGIKDKNWSTQFFLGAPSPRRGVLSLLDNEPIKPATLMHVPKTATYLQVFSVQPSRVLDVTMDVAGAIDEKIVESIQGALKDASKEVGFDLEMKLIRGMGPHWTVYVDPMIAGNGFASIVLVNELQDADSVGEAMAKLSAKANEFFIEEGDDEVKVRFISEEIGGATVTHMGIPFVAPAWTVHKNRLYVSLFPQALEMAVEQSGKREDSILANEAFNTAMARFAEAPGAPGKAFENLPAITGLSFADLPETASEGYGGTMMVMQILTGASEMISGEPSSMRMPPIGKLMPFVEVSGGITRVDNTGMHIQVIEPFPGATMLSASKGITSGAGLTAPMAIAILLPALGEARDEARAMQTISQARQISVANIAYSVDHKGKSADDIAALEPYIGDVELLIAAASKRAEPLPINFADLPSDKRGQYIRSNSSYILIPLGQIDGVQNPSKTVMLFQRPDDGDADELAVAMVDGSVHRMSADELTDSLQKQTGQSIQQLIKRQENFGQ
jgi:hypothetical protein